MQTACGLRVHGGSALCSKASGTRIASRCSAAARGALLAAIRRHVWRARRRAIAAACRGREPPSQLAACGLQLLHSRCVLAIRLLLLFELVARGASLFYFLVVLTPESAHGRRTPRIRRALGLLRGGVRLWRLRT